MNKKELLGLGVPEELVEQVLVSHGKGIEAKKTEIETLTATQKTLGDQIEAANATIATFKDLDVDSIQATADEYKTKYEESVEENAQQLHQVKFDHALNDGISAAKAKNVKAVRSLLDVDEISLGEDGTLNGLDEQLEKVTEENDFLFESEEEEPEVTIVLGTNSDSVVKDSTVASARKAAGLE
jgi:hypothetical protein